MSTAKAIDKRMKQAGHDGPASILTIISDDHNVHCLMEADLDTWWSSLDPVEKADVYEQHLEAQVVAEDASADVQQIAETLSSFLKAWNSSTRGFTRSLNVNVFPAIYPTAPQPSTKGEHHARQTL